MTHVTRKPAYPIYENKCAKQTAHLCILISTFFVQNFLFSLKIVGAKSVRFELICPNLISFGLTICSSSFCIDFLLLDRNLLLTPNSVIELHVPA